MITLKAPQRIFLDWQCPFLESASEWLLSQAQTDSHVDLSHLSILSTVGRAARHLIEKLVTQAEKQNLAISPPNIVSISGLYETLLPDQHLVSALDSELLFFSILKSCEAGVLADLFPNLKDQPEELKFFEKARFLSSTYQDFTKNGNCPLVSIQTLLASGMIPNEERWHALASIFVLYQSKLKELKLLDTQSALALLESAVSLPTSSLILLACHDLTPILKRTLKAGYGDITALIFAPQNEQEGFDEMGCIKADYWEKRESKFDPTRLIVTKSSKDQALKVFSALRTIEDSYFASDITIGALEPGMDRLIEIVGNNYDLPIHLPNKTSLNSSEISLSITRSLQFIISKKFSDLAALLSLQAISNKLPLGDSALTLINNYREENLQPLVRDALPSCPQELLATLKIIDQLISVLNLPNANISEWVTASCSFVTTVCGETLSLEAQAVIEKLNSLVGRYSEETISTNIFLEIVSSAFEETPSNDSSNPAAAPSQHDCIDVVGWLELALDSALITYIVGFNEGFVPGTSTQSPFLPNKARMAIGLEDNTYRLARDAYVLETLIYSKKNLSIFASKISLEGSPLLPSRLSLRGKSEKIASNIISFFSSEEESILDNLNTSGDGFKALYANNFLPIKKILPSPLKVSVTALSDYLNCPYLFYLKHILKLESANPDSRELSALQFGSLIHDIIANFGNSALAIETSESKIEAYLVSLLQSKFESVYGKNPFAEVLVQYHQIASRLRNYAKWQAQWRSAGWQIYKIELPFIDPGYEIKTESGSAILRGRIDRIDFNPTTSEYAVLDFKSGDSTATPAAAYSKTKGWLDLQLPAYLFYASEILELQNVKVGLLPISASSDSLSPKWAEWDDSQIESAWETIVTTVKGIINQEFWPPKITADKAWDFNSIYRAHL